MKYQRVKDYWILNAGWNWEMLSDSLPPPVKTKLASIFLREDGTNDCLCLGLSSSGELTVRTTYDIVTGSVAPHPMPTFP